MNQPNGILTATLPLTNTQFKKLPSTVYPIVAAPEAGFRWKPVAWSISKDFHLGAYSGVDTTYATLVVQTHGGSWVTNPLTNDNTTSPVLADLTTFVGASARVVDLLVPGVFPVPGAAGNAGWSSVILTSSPTDIGGATNGALELAMDNNGSTSDLGGGNADNTFLLTLYYRSEAM